MEYIVFVVENPGGPCLWHYAFINGQLHGGYEAYEDLAAEISQQSLKEEPLWKTTSWKNQIVSDSGPLYPVPVAGA